MSTVIVPNTVSMQQKKISPVWDRSQLLSTGFTTLHSFELDKLHVDGWMDARTWVCTNIHTDDTPALVGLKSS